MKKTLMILASLAFLAGIFSSCKKDYTCACTFDDADWNESIEIPDSKKSDAEDACDALDATAKVISGSCTLK